MALKALDIYKMLPRTNCKKCGYPTCMAFAMKLAAGKADVSLCPDLDDETRAMLGGATRPPVRKVTIGVGERSFAVGEEFVLFRHEKTFYHQPGLIFELSDTMGPEEIRAVADRVRDDVFHRVGEDLRISGVAVRCISGSAEAFAKAVAAIEECGELPEVLIADDPGLHEAALKVCGNFRPLIHAAGEATIGPLSTIAKKYGCPLVVRSEDPETLVSLAKQAADAGVGEIVLDFAAPTPGAYIAMAIAARQSAVERTAPGLGYPLYLDTTAYDPADAAIIAGILRYAGVIVTRPLTDAGLRSAETLRQNIYTDPQKPIQVTPGLYPVGSPGPDAPVLLTVNFSLTFFTLQGYLEASKVPCWLLIVDTEGLSVLTAVAGGKLTEDLIAKSIKESGIEAKVNHHRLIIPGYAAPISGKTEDATGWKVLVGPRDAAEIGEYLEEEWSGA